MKKLVLLLMASMLVASSAFAVVDQDPDMVGMYFDPTADTTCLTGVVPYAQVAAHVILTNPSFDYLYGFEFGYDVTGNAMILSSTFENPQALDVGEGQNFIVGFGSPSACSEATVLVNMTIMNMNVTPEPISFNLRASNPSSNDLGLPTMLLANGQLLPVGYNTLDGNIVAVINGTCDDVVATDATTFDAVKSLYR
jgi:hypothetical protein